MRKDVLEILIPVVIFLIAIVVNAAQFIKKMKNNNPGVDLGELLKKHIDNRRSGKASAEKEEEDYDEEEAYYEEEEFPTLRTATPPPLPVPDKKHPDKEFSSYESAIPQAVAQVAVQPLLEETPPAEEDSRLRRFLRHNGKDAIVIQEILGKPLAFRD